MYRVILLISMFSGCWCAESLFPPGFLFGAATAAYQVEGAWNASGKSENIWDRLTHTRPEFILDRSNGDVACDSYHLWKRDIEMMEELGLNMYRFSVSWSRILPNGFPNYVNMEGVKYYSDLIDGLLEKGIQPLLTLHHFDLPQSLQDLGGWANPLAADWFADYARVVYTLYGDRVKYWVTINEPFGVCDSGYNMQSAPYLDDPKIGMYLCNKNIVMAHAKAWRIYDKEFRPKYHGKLSTTSVFTWLVPMTPDDEEVAELTTQYWEGRYSHPIFSKEGGWPPKVENLLNENAKREGYPYPRLPPFTPEEIELVRGTYDYYGLNYYNTQTIRKARPGEKVGSWMHYGSDEIGIVMEAPSDANLTNIDWFQIYPDGLRQQMRWLNTTYDVLDFMITENGYPSFDTGLDDRQRVECIKAHLEQLLLAINDGFRVIGYNPWSLMDNFEWGGGYKIRFGMYAVDFTSPLRTRTPRESARYYAAVTRSRAVHLTHDGLNYKY